MESHKFVSYNTSYVNDAHYTQVMNNMFMSESAAVVKKAIELKEQTDKSKITDFAGLSAFFVDKERANILFDKLTANNHFVSDQVNVDPENAIITVTNIDDIEREMSNELGVLRMNMADTATEYIKEILTAGVDCISLIEQMIHVPVGHPAFYGGENMKSDLSKDFDNVDVDKGINKGTNTGVVRKNDFFGILRRINLLKSKGVKICDIDSEPSNLRDAQYFIVYDNVVNFSTIKSVPAPAEGIALIVKKSVCPELFEWSVDKHPVKLLLKNDQNSPVTYPLYGTGKFVHYYSDDFGNVVSSYKTEYKGTNSKFHGIKLLHRFRTSTRGTPDLGRPIILTAGMNGTDLNVFVALHNANLFNLAYLGDKFYDENADFEDLLIEGGDVNPKYVTGVEVKYSNGKSTKPRKLGDVAKYDQENSDLKALYEAVIDNIGKFITTAFKNQRYPAGQKPPKNVILYLGGDFNDPNGGIFKLLTTDTRKAITTTIFGKPFDVKIKTQYNDKLISCCANLDSQYPRYAKGFDQSLVCNLETAYDRVSGKVDKYEYQPDFIDSEKFGYFGDYAFIGSSDVTVDANTYQILQLDKAESALLKTESKSVMASDHLPVYASVTISTTSEEKTGGGRRRRYSRRAPIRRTRKGVPKKLRASRRKRRARTYKKF